MVLSMLCSAAFLAVPAQAVTQTFTITEPVGLAWGPDRVNYRVEFPEGQVAPDGVALKNAGGEPVAVQLSDIELWPDGLTIKAATVSFMAGLEADETAAWTLTAGRETVEQPATDLAVAAREHAIELTTSKTGIRLAGGAAVFDAPVAAEQLPAPIQGVRLPDDPATGPGAGAWIGRGWWETTRACLGYRADVLEEGPVFARVRLTYDFTDRTRYEAMVELSAGQDVAVISESFDLSSGESYEFPEVSQTGEMHRYELPRFDPPEKAMLWEWWGGSHGRVPAPHAHYFSFFEGLEPDSCQWYGRMYHEAARPGDGGLGFERAGRVISLNAFFQWGDDESFYFGTYNSRRPELELAIIALRPSQWLHATIEPSPQRILKQWTSTNNLWIERGTEPDLWLKAPTCLGRRVYGVGFLRRRPVQADSVDLRAADQLRRIVGATPVAKDGWDSEIMRRHIRLGRLRLDEIKDWVLDYPEPARYPRLVVPPGDLARMQTRARALPPAGNLHYQGDLMYLQESTPDMARRLLDQKIAHLHSVCQAVTVHAWNHTSFAMGMGMQMPQADVALGAPECTPEEAARIRRYLAFLAYFSMSPDYVPPREAGFGWGAANMMEALRGRAAASMAALLPNHPDGRRWRRFLLDYLVANAKAKINEAGGTLEVGAYGAKGIEFATLPLYALANCGDDVDLSEVLPLLRAAARHRMSVMLPYDLRGDFRPACTFGDSPYSGEGTLSYLALMFAERDPKLFGELMWGIRESSHPGAEQPASMYFDPGAKMTVPDLHSEYFPGCGFVMRNGFPERDETYLSVHAEGFYIGHGHNDQGSFVLYAKGAPLMLDFASQYQPHLTAAWVHNGTVTFDHVEEVRPCPGRDQEGCWYTGKVWLEHTVEPFTCLEPGPDPRAEGWEEAMAKVTHFTNMMTADYAVLEWDMGYLNRTPYMLEATHGQVLGGGGGEGILLDEPIRWRRQYVLVKSPERTHDYLVLRDTLGGSQDFAPALNFWCLAETLEVEGQIATYAGQHGVDLDVYVAEPRAFTPVSHRVSHVQGRELGKNYEKKFGKPFKEEQILLRIPGHPGGGFFTVLVPRQAGEPAPAFETVLDGNGVRVTFADGRVDTVVLATEAGEYTVEGKTLVGDTFVVTRTAQEVKATALGEGSVD